MKLVVTNGVVHLRSSQIDRDDGVLMEDMKLAAHERRAWDGFVRMFFREKLRSRAPAQSLEAIMRSAMLEADDMIRERRKRTDPVVETETERQERLLGQKPWP